MTEIVPGAVMTVISATAIITSVTAVYFCRTTTVEAPREGRARRSSSTKPAHQPGAVTHVPRSRHPIPART